ncbi:MAG: M13 family metallopeptidase [Planctomycetota bacterium]
MNRFPLLIPVLSGLALIGTTSCAMKTGLQRPALDPADMDSSVDPGQDFYEFANGGWLKRNPIPAAYGSWGVFHEVNERNREILHSILEDASKNKIAPEGSNIRKLGDFFASGMAEQKIEAEGAEPLREELQAIEKLGNLEDLRRVVGRLHEIGADVLFSIGAEADFENSDMVIAWVTQGGLGLPDRDYYTRKDESSVKIRSQYVDHVARMLQLLGDDPETSRREAARILEIETSLAEKSLTAVQMRNPQLLANKVRIEEAESLTPRFSWHAFFSEIEAPEIQSFNLPDPDFFKEMDALLASVTFADWKAYLRWHLVHALAPALSSAFVRENFHFYGETLSGTKKMLPRWKRILRAENQALGEALGEAFVARTFSPKAKQRAEDMVGHLLDAMKKSIENNAWMSAATKGEALKKLAAFHYKIGYPDRWRDYSKLKIDRGPYVRNVMRARAFEFKRQIDKIGKAVDDNEWGMTPQMVNAYYHPLRNEIVFPAGILQPPFFSEHADDAVNYGGMGAVIGHEITHGFDDAGSQFDSDGNLRNWWSPKDKEEFQKRAAVLADQFDQYEAVDGLHVNGKLTLGENIADLGGLTIAHAALKKAWEKNPPKTAIDGFTPEQRFYLAWARAWRQNIRPEALKLLVNTNPHAPARFRAVGPLSNLPDFARAFDLDASAPAVRPASERAKIW